MAALIGTTLVIVLVAILLLGVRVFFTKNGKFPNTHIGSSRAMRSRGIACAASQDREAQKSNSIKKDKK